MRKGRPEVSWTSDQPYLAQPTADRLSYRAKTRRLLRISPFFVRSNVTLECNDNPAQLWKKCLCTLLWWYRAQWRYWTGFTLYQNVFVFQSYAGRNFRFLQLRWIGTLPDSHFSPRLRAFPPILACLDALPFQSYVGRDICHGDTSCVSVDEERRYSDTVTAPLLPCS